MPDPDAQPCATLDPLLSVPPSAWSRQSRQTPPHPSSADPDPAFKNNADPCRIRIRDPLLSYLLLLGVGNLGDLQLIPPVQIRIQLPKIMRIHAGSGTMRYI
jgi:hypothetical protein